MVEVEKIGKTDDYVYDISLDGTVVNALGMNVLSNTDGFNFKMPEKFRHTNENPYIGKGLNRLVVKGQEYYDEWGDIMEFNDLFMRNKMGLDEDEVIPASINISRKNYLDLLDNGDVKMVGNTIKSKKMPLYIEKFIEKGARLLLNNRGKEFIELYYDYIDLIYNMKIPLKEIASVGKIKQSISQYKEACNTLTKAGQKKARQAWYELAIKNDLDVNMGDAVYYINTGTKASDSDIKRTTRYYYVLPNGDKVYDLLDEKNVPILNPRGKKISLTKHIDKEYTEFKKKHKTDKNPPLEMVKQYFIKKKFPRVQEEDILEFNCVYINNDLIEDEKPHYCDENLEYNREKYIKMFNNRIRPLFVVFDRHIRETVNEKGVIVNNIIINHPKDRKTFTFEECQMISGQPFNATDEDTYEQLMTMDRREIEFWLSVDKTPDYIEHCEGMDWENIKFNYLNNGLTEEEMSIYRNELEEYENIIAAMSYTDVSNFIEDRTMPKKLEKLVYIDEEDPTTFLSKKLKKELGSIYDIIEREVFDDVETD